LSDNNTREEIVLYRALSGCGSILQGVRALGHKRKDYTTEGMVLGAYLCKLGLQVVEPPELPIGSSKFQWVPVGPGGLAAPLDHNNNSPWLW